MIITTCVTASLKMRARRGVRKIRVCTEGVIFEMFVHMYVRKRESLRNGHCNIGRPLYLIKNSACCPPTDLCLVARASHQHL